MFIQTIWAPPSVSRAQVLLMESVWRLTKKEIIYMLTISPGIRQWNFLEPIQTKIRAFYRGGILDTGLRQEATDQQSLTGVGATEMK